MAKGCCEATALKSVRLKMDGRLIPMNRFVQDVLGRTVLGMVSALKGADAPRVIEIKIQAR